MIYIFYYVYERQFLTHTQYGTRIQKTLTQILGLPCTKCTTLIMLQVSSAKQNAICPAHLKGWL